MMISKAEVLETYSRLVPHFQVAVNTGFQSYLEDQAVKQEQLQEKIRRHKKHHSEDGEEEETLGLDEFNSMDLIYQGNDKKYFTSRLSDADMRPIVKTFEPYAEYIEHVDLRYNLLTDEGVMELSDLLRKTTGLRTLYLQSNSIQEHGALAIFAAIQRHEQLQYVNLNGNSLGTTGANHIIELLKTCPKLVELDLGNTDMTHDSVIKITTILNESNDVLEVLNMDNPCFNSVMQETAIHMGKMISINQGLQKLSLRGFRLRCDGIYTLSLHLLENKRLKVLELSCNQIGPDGAQSLATYIKASDCVLESLFLKANKLGDLGAKAMAQAIAENRSLIHIDMTNNNIHDLGLCRVSEALSVNTTLLSFKLFNNHFGQASLRLFHALFQTPRDNEWYPDFTTYIVDDEVQMAYVETQVPYDIYF